MSSLAQVLPERYGYVVLAVAGGSLVNIYHIVQVAKARKQYSVKAPLTYSEDEPAFNRIMRAHLNYLENYPFFACTMLLGGLQYPRASTSAGVMWLVGRIWYAKAYAEDSSKRGSGFMISSLAQLLMLGNTIGFGLRHAGVIAACRARFSR